MEPPMDMERFYRVWREILNLPIKEGVDKLKDPFYLDLVKLARYHENKGADAERSYRPLQSTGEMGQ